MTDIDTILATIRETSAKATPGEWGVICSRTLHHVETILGNPAGAGLPICSIPKNRGADAAHIAACCPANMAAVIAHIDTLTRERDEARAERDRLDELNAIAVRFVDALRAEVERLKEALKPSAETKVAYWGEFTFYGPEFVDESGNDVVQTHTVPWTTIKEIMAAISARAES